jgi:hypothetical protein
MGLLNKRGVWLLLCTMLLVLPTKAQQPQKKPAPAVQKEVVYTTEFTDGWNNITDDKKFRYTFPTQNNQQSDTNFLADFIRFLLTDAGTFLCWACAIIVILAFIHYLLKNKSYYIFYRSPKKYSPQTSTHTADQETDHWNDLLQKAMQDKNARLTVRYSFMGVLHMLQDKQLIQYRDDKTNFDYSLEIKKTPYHVLFKQLSRTYEYAWYGNYSLPPERLDEYMNTFHNIKQQLQH